MLSLDMDVARERFLPFDNGIKICILSLDKCAIHEVIMPFDEDQK